ncbi:glycosyl transferase family 25 [Bibersteinia trehalosi]|uniref:glycosyltransferase family 25 protein n=1 Tax=Bibersteinia trehalosi TaxID=47735 RepID=UPI0010517726|nr:glycosyltransferase family 25 protein [Bibersteinia trehalosi]TCT15856.1 glycosyl transferase family 25 [Bibersteinia trehalosi]
MEKQNLPKSNSDMEMYLISQLKDKYEEISNLKEKFMHSNQNNRLLKHSYQQKKKEFEIEVRSKQEEIITLGHKVELLAQVNANLHADVRSLRATIALFENSLSWKITRPLRIMMKIIKKSLSLLSRIAKEPSLIKKGIIATKKYGVKYAINKVLNITRDVNNRVSVNKAVFELHKQRQIYILTTKHCFFIAKLIQENLNKLNISSDIVYGKPVNGFGDGIHFVICPQMFDELPSVYIAFQLEQSVSSRWFTDNYIRTLENSYAIFDYSLENIKFLQSKGLYYQQIYFMPLAYNAYYAEDYISSDKEEYDVLFYGDINNERRKKFIENLSKKFKVKIVKDVFGEELYKELNKAKVIVNIHYYEGALLETTRLYECLSLNKLIVSETSSDIDKHKDMQKCIDFIEVGDVDAMCERVDFWLKNDEKRKEQIRFNIDYLNQSPNWFEYYFMRFMLANDWIDFEKFYEIAGRHIHFDTDFICLGLPESVDRVTDFEKDNHYNIQLFPGLRHKKGWIGCGMSYKFMLKKAQEQKIKQITICEDDVEFKQGFEQKYSQIKDYLNSKNDWDVFSGLIADLHSNVKILTIENSNGNAYIHLDKMTSMVFNIYSEKFYPKLLAWDEKNHNVEENAVDRFIENTVECITITTNPYLVGHKEDLHSTLWGANNSIYSEMIKTSERKLSEKIKNFNHKV